MFNSDEHRAKMLRKQFPRSHKKNPPGRDVNEGLQNEPLKKFNLLELAFDSEMDNVEVKGLLPIGSYNVVKEESPVIVVPGNIPFLLQLS